VTPLLVQAVAYFDKVKMGPKFGSRPKIQSETNVSSMKSAVLQTAKLRYVKLHSGTFFRPTLKKWDPFLTCRSDYYNDSLSQSTQATALTHLIFRLG